MLYDLYEGEQIEPGRKSLTYEVAFRDAHRTLTDEDVHAAVESISARLATLDVRLRSG